MGVTVCAVKYKVRTCLLQAVQKIGNLDKEVSKGKEEWMAPLAPSIAKYTEQVKDFLDRLMDVDDNQSKRNS